jgi:hypothetical protein
MVGEKYFTKLIIYWLLNVNRCSGILFKVIDVTSHILGITVLFLEKSFGLLLNIFLSSHQQHYSTVY